MNDTAANRQLNQKMEELDRLIAQFEQHADPASQAAMAKIVQSLLEFHATGLRRIMEKLADQRPDGEQIIHTLAADDLISSLLVLHDLHPDDLTTRLQRALERVQPYLASHGGHVELLSATSDGVVSLRLDGSCHGCPSSRVTLQSTIEQQIYAAAPEVTSIVVEGLVDPAPKPEPAGFVPIERLGIHGNIGSTAS